MRCNNVTNLVACISYSAMEFNSRTLKSKELHKHTCTYNTRVVWFNDLCSVAKAIAWPHPVEEGVVLLKDSRVWCSCFQLRYDTGILRDENKLSTA